ncbi:MAG: hypothetical protein WCC74_01280 [Minisyncoccia bacterium]
MTKKIIIISIISILMTGTAYAQSPALSKINAEKQRIENTKQQIIQVRQEAIDAINNARELASSTRASANIVKGKRAEIKMAVQEIKEQKIETRISKIQESALKDFKVTIKNLDNLNLRINSRINKLEASGTIDMTDSKELLEIASTSISIVRVAVNDFELTDFSAFTTLTESFAPETEKILAEQVKNKIQEIKSLMKDAHSALVDAVTSLTPEQTKNATTTE